MASALRFPDSSFGMGRKRGERRPGILEDVVGGDGSQAVRLVKTAIVKARSAPVLHADDDPVSLAHRPKPRGLSGAEDSHDRDLHRRGNMHGPAVIRDQQVAPPYDGPE